MKFSLRRVFSGYYSNRELEEFATDVSRALEKEPTPGAWQLLEETRQDTAAALGCYLPVNSAAGGILRVLLPSADSANGGRELLIGRLSAVGTVRLLAPSGSTVDGEATRDLPASVGCYRVFFDGRRFLTVRGA